MHRHVRLHARFAAVRIAAVAVTLAAAAGCGGDRIAVTGTVMVDAAPLAKGVIKFVPAQSVDGPTVAANVENGEFHFDTTNGPAAGEHRIEIYADQPLTPGLDDPEEFIRLGGPQGKVKQPPNPIDPQFNTQSTLKETVTAEGDNEFHFKVFSRQHPKRR